jgi:hypothetical protein
LKPLALTCLALLAALSATSAHTEWRLVGEGDCPGRQIIGSLGVAPEAKHCTPEFAGKTALCFTQVCNPGCQYIDVATVDCHGGTETAQVYTCEVSLLSSQPAGK